MTFYQSQTIFMFFYHDLLSNNLHILLHVSLHISLHVFLYDFLSNDLHVFSSWLSIKKIMQKDNAKVEKISIFNFFDIKLEFLTSQVKLTQFSKITCWSKNQNQTLFCIQRLHKKQCFFKEVQHFLSNHYLFYLFLMCKTISWNQSLLFWAK